MNKWQKGICIAAVFVLPPLLITAELLIKTRQAQLALNSFALPLLYHWLTGCGCALYGGVLLHSGCRHRDRAVGLCALASALLLLLCTVLSYAEAAISVLGILPHSIRLALGTEFTLSALFTTVNAIAGILLLRKSGTSQK